mgnify:CR=1 FL=1
MSEAGGDIPRMPDGRRPTIGITMGEPAGIGPEIVVKALADPAIRRLGRFIIYGMNELMAYAAEDRKSTRLNSSHYS